MKQVEQRMFRDDKGELTSLTGALICESSRCTMPQERWPTTQHTSGAELHGRRFHRPLSRERQQQKAPAWPHTSPSIQCIKAAGRGLHARKGKEVWPTDHLFIWAALHVERQQRRSENAFPWAPPGKPGPFFAPRRAKSLKEKEGIQALQVLVRTMGAEHWGRCRTELRLVSPSGVAFQSSVNIRSLALSKEEDGN